MFEVAEVGRSLSREDYKNLEPDLHYRLLKLQERLRASNLSLIVIVAGVEGAGKGEVVDKLYRWFDSRDVQTHAFWNETDEERERPRFWRFWRTLPARGAISVMFTSWYSTPIQDRVFVKLDDASFESELQHVVDLERTLTEDGTIIVKLWYHLSRELQGQRLEEDARERPFKKSPFIDQYTRLYDSFTRVSERTIHLTDTGFAPWHIIESGDHYYRDLTTGQLVAEALESGLKSATTAGNASTADTTQADTDDVVTEQPTVLDALDLNLELSADEYEQRLYSAQRRLNRITWDMNQQKKNAVLVFEGWDAAGKGSAIRRLTAAIDARLYRVIPIAAPSDEELSHHYLWRFWRQVPRAGFISIYDRSWYGRVLIERVEGLASREQWQRAYREINNFEEHLTRHGTTVLKFWIHISDEEQLHRFKARETDPRKQHKLTEADWRNRKRRAHYELAVDDMVAHTSTDRAPWHLVPGDDKRYARVTIIERVCERLEQCIAPVAADHGRSLQ